MNVQFKEVASLINGYPFKPSDWSDTGLPIIRIQDLTGTTDKPNHYEGQYPKKIEVNDGDILISWSASLGVYRWNKGKALLNQHIFKVGFNKKPIDRGYFVWAVEYKLTEMKYKTHGSTMKHIVKGDFDAITIPYPSISDQANIASQLDNIKKLISAKEEELSNLDCLVKSRFMEMFPDWDLSLQKADWIELKALTKIYTGTTPKTEQKDYWNGDIPWVTPAELNSDSYIVSDTERHLTEAGRASKSLSLMPVGTVLLTTRAPIGKVAICGVPMACNQGFKNFECGSELNPTFLYVLLKLNVEWLQSQGTGTTFKEISKTKAEGIKISVPDIESQVAFENFYKLIDKSRFVCHSRNFL